jgi:hypothetical protein
MDIQAKINQFKNLSLLKQSFIAVGVIGVLIGILSNYKNIKTGIDGLVQKYKDNENVKEFIADVSVVAKPVIDKVNSILDKEAK